MPAFFGGAAQASVRQAIYDGTLTLADLQKASPATRALDTAQRRLSGYAGTPRTHRLSCATAAACNAYRQFPAALGFRGAGTGGEMRRLRC